MMIPLVLDLDSLNDEIKECNSSITSCLYSLSVINLYTSAWLSSLSRLLTSVLSNALVTALVSSGVKSLPLLGK